MTMAAMALGFASCSEDTDPKLQIPAAGSYEVYPLEIQDQAVTLTEGQTIILTSKSQPDYGYSAVTNYTAELALSEADFNREDGFIEIASTGKVQSRMTLKQSDIAAAICTLLGISDQEGFDSYVAEHGNQVKVYLRGVAQLSNLPDTRIVSNAVPLNYVKFYLAIRQPGAIYLVGSPEGWAGPEESNAAHYKPWRLLEPQEAIGSKIYSAVFDLPADPMFRFYTALTGWDDDSWGSQGPDSPIDFQFTDGSFATGVVKGKGAFNFPGLPAGKYTLTVDMSNPDAVTFTMVSGSQEIVPTTYIYLVGGISGWMAPDMSNESAYAPYRLACATGDGVYTGTFPATAGHCNFRFATKLSDDDGWNNPDQIGAQTADADVACSFTNNAFSGPYVSGKGNWAFELEQDCKITMTVDTNNEQVSFTLITE